MKNIRFLDSAKLLVLLGILAGATMQSAQAMKNRQQQVEDEDGPLIEEDEDNPISVTTEEKKSSLFSYISTPFSGTYNYLFPTPTTDSTKTESKEQTEAQKVVKPLVTCNAALVNRLSAIQQDFIETREINKFADAYNKIVDEIKLAVVIIKANLLKNKVEEKYNVVLIAIGKVKELLGTIGKTMRLKPEMLEMLGDATNSITFFNSKDLVKELDTMSKNTVELAEKEAEVK